MERIIWSTGHQLKHDIAAVLPVKLNIGNEIPVLLLRIGYAEPMPFAPRKEVKEVIQFNNN